MSDAAIPLEYVPLLFLGATTQAILIMLFVWWLADKTTPSQAPADS